MSLLSQFLRRLAVPAVAAGLAFSAAAPARAVTLVISYTDPAGYGFNDTTPYTKPPFSAANPGTLGGARRAALEAAVHNWGNRLKGTIPITIDAAFEAMGGTANSATLAYAGPEYYIAFNGTTAEVPYIWFLAAHAAQFANQDFSPGQAMIQTRFNSDVDGPVVLGSLSFYYGLDGQPTGIDFYHTILHEFGHGLGFFSLAEAAQSGGSIIATGNYYLLGGIRAPAVYDIFLANGATSGASLLALMTPAQRKPLYTGGALYFSGANARTLNGGVNPRIYAPSPYQSGSSISHVDEATYRGTVAAPSVNELMTPNAGPGAAHTPGPVATGIFQDMLWEFTPYTGADAAAALRLASGLSNPNADAFAHLNVVAYNTHPGKVDMSDALKIARMAAGAERNPNP